MKSVLIVIAVLIVAASALPWIRRDEWWIRVFDFPRLQIAVIGLLTWVSLLLVGDFSSVSEIVVFAALTLSLLYQGYKIYPYTAVAPQQVLDSAGSDPQRCVSLMVANVLMDNRNSERFLHIVGNADPDILLTLEPDDFWEQQLRVLEETHPFTVKRPLDNRYGMLLHSRLELVDTQILNLVKEGVPSFHTKVRLASGDLIRLHCVHPEPPSPTEAETSTKRDAELLIVGREIHDLDQPVIVTGDLNDVAWSDTTKLFQKSSGLLDPRIGRGMFNSFNAKIPLLRWPLDHVFHSDDLMLVEITRMPAFGSDHFPLYIKLHLDSRAEALQEKPAPPDTEQQEQVEEKIDRVEQRDQIQVSTIASIAVSLHPNWPVAP
jgi:endonuclease/exonuclease/phosphatase (EEP) superfamily protein YafD